MVHAFCYSVVRADMETDHRDSFGTKTVQLNAKLVQYIKNGMELNVNCLKSQLDNSLVK